MMRVGKKGLLLLFTRTYGGNCAQWGEVAEGEGEGRILAEGEA